MAKKTIVYQEAMQFKKMFPSPTPVAAAIYWANL
jgi:hypothetical protein